MSDIVRPLPPGPVQYDDDGNSIPQPAAESDLADLIALAEYCRAKGFVLGPTVRVGKIVTQIRDVRQAERLGRDAPQIENTSIWDEHAVPALAPDEE